MSKIMARSSNGLMLKIGEDSSSAVWYFMSDKVKEFSDKLELNTEVEIKFNEEKSGDKRITFLTVNKGASKENVTHTSHQNTTSNIDYQKMKNPQESDQIKKLSVLSTSALAVATAMQGQLTVDTLGDMTCTLFDKLYKKVS
jgi:hypothetical protein